MANARGVQYRNYLVLWKPRNVGATVNEIKCIDAWSSTGTLTEQREQAECNYKRYRKEHGDGYVCVVESKLWAAL